MNLEDHPEKVFECGQCPACGSHNIRVTHTDRPVRRMLCADCRVRWKTITVNQLYDESLQVAAAMQKRKYQLNYLDFL